MVQSAWDEERAKNWHLFMPPARPSKGEVGHYERAVLSILSECPGDLLTTWALFGATPEIRSLAAKYKRELLCIDRDAGVFDALRSLVHPRYSEKFICSEWLAAEISQKVDVVFADGSINMLPLPDHVDFLKKISGVLNNRGWALLRVHLMGPPRFSSPAEVFEWYRASHLKEPVFSATRTYLDMLWVEPETLKLSFVEFHKKIQKLYDDKLMTPEEFIAYNQLLQFNKINLYYTTRESFEGLAMQYFHIEGVHFGGDYIGHQQHPVYVLRKKNPDQ